MLQFVLILCVIITVILDILIVFGLEHLINAQYMPESAKLRITNASVSSRCKFDEIEKLWDREHVKGKIVWNCVHNHVCGGNGDRLKGIGNTIYHAIRLQYDLKIEWNNPIDVNIIFAPSTRVPWNESVARPPQVEKTLTVNAVDNHANNPCTWQNYDRIEVSTNYMQHTVCDNTIRNKRLQELLFHDDLVVHDNRWTINPKLGCMFWYIFKLQDNLVHLY